MKLENDYEKLAQLLDSQQEWLLIHASGANFALDKSEVEIEIKYGKILFGFLDEKGFQMWRVTNFQEKRREITLNLTRNYEKEREKIRLVPRVSSKELSESVELARLEKANEIARSLISENKKTRLVRIALNKENGRFAQIIFEDSEKNQIAALADLSGELTPEIHLTTAILRLLNLSSRKQKPFGEIWILSEKKLYKNLCKLHALLREDWKRKIKILEISRKITETKIITRKNLTIPDLWREKPRRISLPINTELSRAAREIIKIAPEKIDVLATKNGETLRFFGLPFARVRKVAGAEKCWFGVEREKRILNETSRADFFDLIENLEIYRRFNAPNKRHALFRLAPEAWLESVLRRNIKLLDKNLILSPLYNQFRAGRAAIDLLALRKDKRLIIIEIKAAPDREMIFQAADYWRKVELYRRNGSLSEMKLFGDLKTADAPTIVYLVAPALSFHGDYEIFVKTVSPEIEIYRFDLAENWRENPRVVSVKKA